MRWRRRAREPTRALRTSPLPRLLVAMLSHVSFVLAIALLCLWPYSTDALVAPRGVDAASWNKAGRHLDSFLGPRSPRNQTELESARLLVQAAIAETSVRNKARVLHPLRNTYHADSAAAASAMLRERDGDGQNASFTTRMLSPAPPLLQVSDQVASAAALLAELGASGAPASATTVRRATTNSSSSDSSVFWMENISRKHYNSSSHQVFRNVRDFGARGDGRTDDTVAIRRAILSASSGTQDTEARWPGSDGVRNAVVYLPSGTYLVSGTIPALPATQITGDATNFPVLKAAPSFVGLGVISTNELGPGGEASQKRQHYRQIRNLIIDITEASHDAHVSGIHWQASEASSIQHVEVRAADPHTAPGGQTTQMGIFTEDGSGGQISDVAVRGGSVGILAGNSQFAAQRIRLSGCTTGVQLLWDFGGVWKGIDIRESKVGFSLANRNADENNIKNYLGSVYIMDSTFTDVGTAVQNAPVSVEPGTGTTSVTLDNVLFDRVTNRVFDGEKEYVEGRPSTLDTWTLGPIYLSLPERDLSLGYEFPTPREPTLLEEYSVTAKNSSGTKSLPKRPFFEKSKPQYTTIPASSWVHMKDFAKGDGKTDDTVAFQEVLNGKGYIFVDAGDYLLADTVTIHPGTFIVGEAWPKLVAFGPKFSDPRNPRPLVKVGDEGSVGAVDLQDLLFTTRGPTAGAKVIEWNIKADKNGNAAMWDCHVQVGGTSQTKETPAACASSSNATCQGAAVLVHITPGASAYLEGLWLRAVDRLLDAPESMGNGDKKAEIQFLSVPRGVLVESQAATWMYGVSVQHASMYQYNFRNSQKVFVSMLQAESPSTGPESLPTRPRSDIAVVLPGDAGTPNPRGSWATVVQGTKDVFMAGLGLYSWFSQGSTACISSQSCQDALILMQNNTNLAIHNLVTIGAKNSIDLSDSGHVTATENLAIDAHPNWSQITVVYPIQNMADAMACRDPGSWPATPPNGKFRNADFNDQNRFFVSMINGSPYRLSLTRKNSYQMTEFTYADVGPGFSPQFSMYYGPGTFVDTNGEAYYRLEGTSKSFQVHGTTNNNDSKYKLRARYVFDGMSANGVPQGSRYELRSRGGERAVNFVLTGSEKVGYWTSVNPPVAWMNALLPIIGGRKLKHISMLGSHNAGISFRNGGTIGPEAASLCQGLNIYGQLMAGSRWFDIRPVIGNGGQLLTGHYSGQRAPVFGINGQALADIVDDINRFTATNPELVIVSLSHAMQTDEGYRDLNDAEWDRVFDALERLDSRCAGLAGQVPDMTLDSLIGAGRACVVVLSDGGRARPDRGIYRPADSFDLADHWSDSDKVADMTADQAGWVRANRNLVSDPGARRDRFLISQHILTVKALNVLVASIEGYAVDVAYDALFWRVFSAYTPWSFPSVLLMDYVGILYRGDRSPLPEAGEARALVMAVNVGLASRNCWLGGGSLE
ncbi:hypothetical protein RB601_007892 [Gaeumannomyces tritici]